MFLFHVYSLCITNRIFTINSHQCLPMINALYVSSIKFVIEESHDAWQLLHIYID